MLVKDLKDDISLGSMKVKIPQKYKHSLFSVGLKTDEVYITSSWFSGIWVKTDLNSQKVYPLQIPPSEVLDWELA